MERKDITLESCGWSAEVMFDVTAHDLPYVTSRLYACGATSGIVRRVADNVTSSVVDFGVTFSNTEDRHSVVIIGRSSGEGQFANTWMHETYHLARHIAQASGMHGEEPAYVAGEIAYETHRQASKRMCKCCSKKNA